MSDNTETPKECKFCKSILTWSHYFKDRMFTCGTVGDSRTYQCYKIEISQLKAQFANVLISPVVAGLVEALLGNHEHYCATKNDNSAETWPLCTCGKSDKTQRALAAYDEAVKGEK